MSSNNAYTKPHSDFSFPSMILSNWKDLTITWAGPRDNPNQKPMRSPGVTGMRRAENNWAKSAISEESFAMRVNGTLYSDPSLWDGRVFLKETGEFENHIDTYDGKPLPFTMKRSYYLPPQEEFYIVRYSVSLPQSSKGPSTADVQLLDYVVTEKNADAPQVKQWGWFNTYESVPLWMVDETKSGQGYFTMGTWDANAVSSYQVGQATDATSPLSQFIHKEGHLGKELVAEELQVSLGLVVSETLAAGQSLDLYFFRTLHTTYDKAVATCKRALAQPPAYWIDRTQAAYAYFLAKGKQPKFTDPEHERLYKHSVLMMKNAQNPTVGCIVASFHPAYLYKTWMRDGMFAAMIFDAAGYHEEARAFFVWAASCHLRWGRQGFHTCYSYWTGEPVGFVDPQFDSAGAFLVGVYHHYRLTRCTSFLEKVKHGVRDIENFLGYGVGMHGFAPADYSIWEESSHPHTGGNMPTAYFTFTQAMAAAGLQAAATLEEVWGDKDRARFMQERSKQVQNAIETHLWKEDADGRGGYYMRCIASTDGATDERLDGSSVAVVYLGVGDPKRAVYHLAHVRKELTQRGYGIGRYAGDPFFYDSIFSPGGMEAGGPTPPWGVVTMFTAFAELEYERILEDAATQEECKGKEAASEEIDAVPEVLPPLVAATAAAEGQQKKVVQKPIDYQAIMLKESPREVVRKRLQWMVDHAAEGQMPVGEAICGVTGNFVPSSTPNIYEYAGVYIWAVLMEQGLCWLPNPKRWTVQ